jgi:hypothetical protein
MVRKRERHGYPPSQHTEALAGDYEGVHEPYWFGRIWRLINRGMYRGTYSIKNHKDLMQNSRLAYKQHHATVRRLLKDQPGCLLEYKMSDGGRPLCDFINKQVPSTLFPWLNDREAMKSLQVAIPLKVLATFVWQGLKPLGLMWRACGGGN